MRLVNGKTHRGFLVRHEDSQNARGIPKVVPSLTHLFWSVRCAGRLSGALTLVKRDEYPYALIATWTSGISVNLTAANGIIHNEVTLPLTFMRRTMGLLGQYSS